jgi:methionyl-tRNA formyltransferase
MPATIIMQRVEGVSMRILYLGTPDFAAIPLEALAADKRYTLVGVVTQPDRSTGRSSRLQPPPVKQQVEALKLDIPVLQPETLRDPAAVAQIAALRPDVGVVAAYGEILRKSALEIPPLGYLNIHPSLLPRHRGPTPVAGAILAGDSETGVTLMRLDAKMDSGPILAQRRVPLRADARTPELTKALFRLGSELLIELLARYAAGAVTLIPQDDSQATYTPLLHKEDGKIAWDLPAVQIERMTRAYDPWPGAWTTWQLQQIKILAADVHADWTGDAPPGTVFDRHGGVWVATGAGALELVRVQPAGKRQLAAAEWRHGLRRIDGARLGD